MIGEYSKITSRYFSWSFWFNWSSPQFQVEALRGLPSRLWRRRCGERLLHGQGWNQYFWDCFNYKARLTCGLERLPRYIGSIPHVDLFPNAAPVWGSKIAVSSVVMLFALLTFWTLSPHIDKFLHVLCVSLNGWAGKCDRNLCSIFG